MHFHRDLIVIHFFIILNKYLFRPRRMHGIHVCVLSTDIEFFALKTDVYAWVNVLNEPHPEFWYFVPKHFIPP